MLILCCSHPLCAIYWLVAENTGRGRASIDFDYLGSFFDRIDTLPLKTEFDTSVNTNCVGEQQAAT